MWIPDKIRTFAAKTKSSSLIMLQQIGNTLGTALGVSNSEVLTAIISSYFSILYMVTTRSLSRHSWLSERSWFRFLSGNYTWINAFVALFAQFSYEVSERYILGFDETMQAKSRYSTYGIDRFYNSIIGIVQRGIGFFGCSLISIDAGKSYFMGLLQIIRTPHDKARTAAIKAKKSQAKGKAKKGTSTTSANNPQPKPKPKGHPKGAKNKPKSAENTLETASFRTFKRLFVDVMTQIKAQLPNIQLHHIVGDSAYATLQYMELALSEGLYLISKVKRNTVICFPFQYTEQQPYTHGRPKVYGKRIDNENPPAHTLKNTTIQDNIKTEHFQFEGYMKGIFGQIILNILIVRTTDTTTNKTSILIFCSNDLNLTHSQLWDYYHLRYQIEFDFRDAKQHFGFADFKNYKQNNVTNFVNLAFMMCLIAKIIIPYYRQQYGMPKLGITDLKIIFNARFTLKSFLNDTQNDQNPIFNAEAIHNFMPKTLINAA